VKSHPASVVLILGQPVRGILTKRTLERIISRKFKATTEKMGESLKLMQATPIMLGAQSK
jgi:hypothetical protein